MEVTTETYKQCTQAIVNLQEIFRDNEHQDYQLGGFTIKCAVIHLHVNAFTVEGLNTLKSMADGNDLGHQIEKALIPRSGDTEGFSVELDEESYNEGKLFFESQGKVPHGTLAEIAGETSLRYQLKLCTGLGLDLDMWIRRFGGEMSNRHGIILQMLEHWMETTNTATCESLRSALRVAGLNRLADKYLTLNFWEDVPSPVLRTISYFVASYRTYIALGMAMNFTLDTLNEILKEKGEDMYDEAAYHAMDLWRNEIGLHNRCPLRQVLYQAGLERVANHYLSEKYRDQNIEQRRNSTVGSDGTYLRDETTKTVNDVARKITESVYFKLGKKLQFASDEMENFLHQTQQLHDFNSYTIATKLLIAKWAKEQESGCDQFLINSFREVGLLPRKADERQCYTVNVFKRF